MTVDMTIDMTADGTTCRKADMTAENKNRHDAGMTA